MTNDYGNLELHKVLLSAMKDIDMICRENGLSYYLYAGTLLGAINYKGFIPWDDDVDIVMFQEDFLKFKKIIEDNYSKWYEMHGFENDKTFYTKMNALRIKGTVMNFEKESHEIFIDIQVLHNIPDKKLARWRQRKEIEFVNLILCTKLGQIIPTSRISKLILGNMAKISRKKLGMWLDKIMTRYDKIETEYVGIMCNTMTCNPYTGRNGYDNDMTKKVSHANAQYIPFEDTYLMSITSPEEDLERRYGPNWNMPYPEEKRVKKHGVKSYSICEEVRERVGL